MYLPACDRCGHSEALYRKSKVNDEMCCSACLEEELILEIHLEKLNITNETPS